jgi:dTDP-4-amino-4,6-dideoxygalactose transaminase
MLEARKRNAEAIRKTIDEIDQVYAQKIPKGYTHSHYVCAPVVEDDFYTVDHIIKELKARDIASRRIYALGCHLQPTYHEGIKEWRWNEFVDYPDYTKVRLPVTEKISTSHFELPVHPGVTKKEIELIQNALTEILT